MAHQAIKVFQNLDGSRLPNLEDVSALIDSGTVKRVIIMAGAGISTAAGIPDFRSPGTGIYSKLEKYNLPYPEAIFDIEYFRENPVPFFTLAKELNPKKFKPTKTHQFFKLLENKKLLKKCFTQNIDGLERLTGLSDQLIVEAHGSFSTCHCLECRSETSGDEFMVRLNESHLPVVKCLEKSCIGRSTAFVKPDIVFFGESLPSRFFTSLADFSEADLLIIMGTSLQVQPFASLISAVPSNCPRVFINLEFAGNIDLERDPGGFDFEGLSRGGNEFIRDVLFLGTTDAGVEKFCALLGWKVNDKDELLELYRLGFKKQTHHENINHEETVEIKDKAEEKLLIETNATPQEVLIPSTELKGDVKENEAEEIHIEELATDLNNLLFSNIL